MKIQLDPLALHKIPDSKRVREEKGTTCPPSSEGSDVHTEA